MHSKVTVAGENFIIRYASKPNSCPQRLQSQICQCQWLRSYRLRSERYHDWQDWCWTAFPRCCVKRILFHTLCVFSRVHMQPRTERWQWRWLAKAYSTNRRSLKGCHLTRCGASEGLITSATPLTCCARVQVTVAPSTSCWVKWQMSNAKWPAAPSVIPAREILHCFKVRTRAVTWPKTVEGREHSMLATDVEAFFWWMELSFSFYRWGHVVPSATFRNG